MSESILQEWEMLAKKNLEWMDKLNFATSATSSGKRDQEKIVVLIARVERLETALKDLANNGLMAAVDEKLNLLGYGQDVGRFAREALAEEKEK